MLFRCKSFIKNIHINGLSMLEIKQHAAEFGCKTKIIKCSKDDIRSITFPAIARIYEDSPVSAHYVVFLGLLDNNRINVVDATSGKPLVFFIDKLGNVWNGELIIVDRASG